MTTYTLRQSRTATLYVIDYAHGESRVHRNVTQSSVNRLFRALGDRVAWFATLPNSGTEWKFSK